jgi:predicted N-acyltransferase
VAGALFFQRGRHLYGRYWGCLPGFESLHFELCYHRPIERCLAEGWTRFEAGAQGDHKLKRGLMPAPIRSSHWLAHAGLAAAVQQATLREGQSMERHMAQMAAHGPFRRGESR